MTHATTNHFTFLNLPTQFLIDGALLDANFRKIQAEAHPDKFVTASPAERLQSMQTATLANEAYQTLKNPTTRARYLLQLKGVESLDERNTAMPMDFLMQQMEWRESIEEAEQAKDIDALDKQRLDIKKLAKALQALLPDLLDSQPEEAAQVVRKLTFLDKVNADINQIISQLDD
jgi:molecular chaperone HscB